MINICKLVYDIEKLQLKTNIPEISIGDTIKVDVLLDLIEKSEDKKADKQRIQAYEGTVIAKQRTGINTTITVRRIFQGIGVERIFPLYSPCIQKIQVLKKAKVRRSKLYYLRNRVGKGTRLKERNISFLDKSNKK